MPSACDESCCEGVEGRRLVLAAALARFVDPRLHVINCLTTI